MQKFKTIIGTFVLISSLAAGQAYAASAAHDTSGQTVQQNQIQKLIRSARSQVGVTLSYDPSYTRLSFPNGDVDRSKGVCTDVIIRAYRDAFTYDLQAGVNRDMKSNFSIYPKNWGLSRPDSNIDHRRVPNLQVFFKRHAKVLPVTNSPSDYQPGDIVTQMLPGNLPHILIISDKKAADGITPLVIHNIGRGTREEDSLFQFKITGHYRFLPN
ncbi:DUF1287 domain-containing protein [Microvirga sp. W0021]|uniref:DUF1287 domain-containing protein n=1 Tax=Hohaiivirga grylli TaxID=3133970 RepID=A0ABV0BHS5_9HYPH